MQPMPIRNVGRIEANPLQQMPIRSAGRVNMPQRNFVSQNPFELERQRNIELLKNYLSPKFGDRNKNLENANENIEE